MANFCDLSCEWQCGPQARNPSLASRALQQQTAQWRGRLWGSCYAPLSRVNTSFPLPYPWCRRPLHSGGRCPSCHQRGNSLARPCR